MFAKVKPNTHFIGQNLIYFVQLDSTNNEALNLCRNRSAKHGTVVICDNQTSGRGQQNRKWHSEPGQNLTFSIILIPDTDEAGPFLINKAVTLGVFNVINTWLPGHTVIKWPNDIYHNGKKIAGILIENSFSGQHLQYCVAGIGINVNEHMAAAADLTATSFANELRDITDREALLAALCESAEKEYLKISQPELVTKAYCQALWGRNELCRFSLDNGDTFSSKVHDVDDHGRIAITYNNEVQYFNYGTIRQMV